MLLLPQSSWAKKLAIKLETLPPLKKMGGWMIAKVKEREILFIRDTESNICALSPFCSHQKYRLQYNPETRQIVCKNHGSIFDLKGKALKGPAKEALKPLYWTSLDREKDRLLIKVD
jgi:nitrite reductase/ring-hydroxylating ferredoxin subunit